MNINSRELLFSRLGTTDMIKQSKTHPFNLSRGVKTFLPRIMKKGNKAVNFYFVFESFYQILLKANKRDTVDLREGTSPKLALA